MQNLLNLIKKLISSVLESDKFYENIQNSIENKFDPKPFEIDFSESFWYSFKNIRISSILTILMTTTWAIYTSGFVPIFVYALSNKSLDTITYTIIGYLIITVILSLVSANFYINVQRVSGGVKYCAYRYFLTIDPIFHSTKSSGQILAKVNRSSSTLLQLINLIVLEILPSVTKQILIAGSFFALGYQIGFGLSLLVLLQLVIVFILRNKMVIPVTKQTYPAFNQNYDKINNHIKKLKIIGNSKIYKILITTYENTTKKYSL
jgi:ABC-type multidrug transport system fused ATPase/permease subunit